MQDDGISILPEPRLRIVVIGAGSRGHAYARPIHESHPGFIAAVCEPIAYKRQDFCKRFIWRDGVEHIEDQEFDDWQMFVKYERSRRERERAGERVLPGFDAAFVCTLDGTHVEIVEALADLGLAIMCEKPLATSLEGVIRIWKAIGRGKDGDAARQKAVFGIGHVLRYSPHNMLLKQMVREDKIVGNLVSMEHTEPVGWWHFSHSYVRGNWRKESTTGPSLLTKSCHDIDFILWLMCSPPSNSPSSSAHLPASVSSHGRLTYFRRSLKPEKAGSATNCLSCPAEPECMYSAKKIYDEQRLKKGATGWPLKIVNPEIEECLREHGPKAAEEKLMRSLAEDYDTKSMSEEEIDGRPWFGRCVWESDNDVCDDQTVMIQWNGESDADTTANGGTHPAPPRHLPKSALFHMIAFTEAQCERRGRIYGTKGEISYNSTTIQWYDFATGQSKTYHPKEMGGGHGGGDAGLSGKFVEAVQRVKKGDVDVVQAQRDVLGVTVEECIRSHAFVWAAEESRRQEKVVEWRDWWQRVTREYGI